MTYFVRPNDKISLNRFRHIPRSLAFVLLLLFVLSQAPKAFLHNALAKHKDEIVCLDHFPTKACVHEQPFHCGFDDLVVTVPFLFNTPLSIPAKPVIFVENKKLFFSSFLLSISSTQHSGRAPPVV